MAGRLLSVKDFGGDRASLDKNKGHVKSKNKVAKSNIKALLQEFHTIAEQEKQLKARREALRDEIMSLTKDSLQEDDKGNKMGVIGKFSVKHEIRRSQKLIPYDELDPKVRKWVDKYQLFHEVTESVPDEEHIDELVSEGIIKKEKLKRLFSETESFALKVTEVEEDDE